MQDGSDCSRGADDGNSNPKRPEILRKIRESRAVRFPLTVKPEETDR